MRWRLRRVLYDALPPEEAAHIVRVRRLTHTPLGDAPARVRGRVACRDFVEMVTAYLDHALPPDDVQRIDSHLAGCDDCSRVLAQWRRVISLTGHLAEDDVDGIDHAVRDELLNAFRAQPPAGPD